MEISKVNINGVEYDIISEEQRQRIEVLEAAYNKWTEAYIAGCGIEPADIKSQNNVQTLKAKELKDYKAPDFSHFWYTAEKTKLITEYGNTILSNNHCCYNLWCFKGDYITTDEDDLVTIYYGNCEHTVDTDE